jgi:hypothetical protein
MIPQAYILFEGVGAEFIVYGCNVLLHSRKYNIEEASRKDFMRCFIMELFCSIYLIFLVQFCTGGSFPGVKRGRGVTLTTHPHLVPRLRMSKSYTSSPPMCLHGAWRDSFTFF